jgi:acetyl esterase/lipase
MIYVVDYEILLNASSRYAVRMETAGGDVVVHVWRGMPHVPSGFVRMARSASEALDVSGAFILQLPQAGR